MLKNIKRKNALVKVLITCFLKMEKEIHKGKI